MKSTSKLIKALLGGVTLLTIFTLVLHASAQTCTPPPADLVSWWPGDGDATDIADGNDGALQGATFATGKVGQAFSFDGVNDFVEVLDSPSLDFSSTSPITVDLWAFRTGTSPVMHLMGKREGCAGGSGTNYQMALNTTSGEGLVFGGGGSGVVTGMDLSLNTWTHLAGTFVWNDLPILYQWTVGESCYRHAWRAERCAVEDWRIRGLRDVCRPYRRS